MFFSQAVGDYLDSWEGHNELHGLKLQELAKMIEHTTLDELNTEYNVLSRQNLWVNPLIDLFYTELLRRIIIEGTFAISTSWTSIEEWMKYPFVYIRVGFEDAYVLTNSDGTLITADDTFTDTFAVTTDSFPEKTVDNILRLLINREIVATAQILNDSISIIAIENRNDPNEKIVFAEEMPGSNIMKVRATIYELADFNLIRQMLDGLRSETFNIVDPYEQRLKDYEDFKTYPSQTSSYFKV